MKNKAIIVASEKLTDYKKDWHEIPVNHYLHIKTDLSFEVKHF
jgi:predicted glutamine amidotransferase